MTAILRLVPSQKYQASFIVMRSAWRIVAGPMIKAFWSFAGLTVCTYAVSVLIQFGFKLYFGIPWEFVTVSIATNIIYFFSLITLIKEIALASPLWTLFILGIFVGLSIFWCWCNPWATKFVRLIGAILMIVIVFLCFRFGSFLAEIQEDFLVVPPGCLAIDKEREFIVPAFYNDEAIVVPVDFSKKKITGGFALRPLAELDCTLQTQRVGPMKK